MARSPGGECTPRSPPPGHPLCDAPGAGPCPGRHGVAHASPQPMGEPVPAILPDCPRPSRARTVPHDARTMPWPALQHHKAPKEPQASEQAAAGRVCCRGMWRPSSPRPAHTEQALGARFSAASRVPAPHRCTLLRLRRLWRTSVAPLIRPTQLQGHGWGRRRGGGGAAEGRRRGGGGAPPRLYLGLAPVSRPGPPRQAVSGTPPTPPPPHQRPCPRPALVSLVWSTTAPITSPPPHPHPDQSR